MEGEWWYYFAVEIAPLIGGATLLGVADLVRTGDFVNSYSDFLGLAVLVGMGGENFQKGLPYLVI